MPIGGWKDLVSNIIVMHGNMSILERKGEPFTYLIALVNKGPYKYSVLPKGNVTL